MSLKLTERERESASDASTCNNSASEHSSGDLQGDSGAKEIARIEFNFCREFLPTPVVGFEMEPTDDFRTNGVRVDDDR